jgi:hypothetical protein
MGRDSARSLYRTEISETTGVAEWDRPTHMRSPTADRLQDHDSWILEGAENVIRIVDLDFDCWWISCGGCLRSEACSRARICSRDGNVGSSRFVPDILSCWHAAELTARRLKRGL